VSEITFTVSRDEAQVILNALGEQPFRVVAGLVSKLLQQANAPAPAPPPAPTVFTHAIGDADAASAA
jgi:hypothetical protein